MNKAQKLLESLYEVSLGVGSKSILIYDGGMFTALAERLARDFGKTIYHVPYYGADLKIARSYLGKGLEGVTVVTDFFSHLDKNSLVFFPDCYNEDLVESLRSQGYNVLGSGKSAILELNKAVSRGICEGAGIKMAPATKVKGLEELKRYLEGKNNKVIKPVVFRGESETFKYEDAESSKSIFDKISLSLGPYASEYEFMVEDMIEGLECGVDGITFDGKLLNPLMFGFTSGYMYLAKVMNQEELPELFKVDMDKLSKIFGSYNTRMFFGTEEIYDKKSSFLLDLTMRMSNIHVSGLWTELMDNFSDFVYALGMGKPIDASVSHKYAASAVLVMSNDVTEWVTVKAPPEASKWLKLEYNSKANGDYYLVPKEQNTVGAIIGVGDSWEEVIESIQENFEQLEGSATFDPLPSPEEFMEVIDKIKEYGIDFE
jgi:hypothetical protein